MSYFQPLITSAFSNYSVNRNIYVDRATVQDKPAENQKTEQNQNKVNLPDPDFGKPKSASGDVLDLSQDIQKQTETKSDVRQADRTEENQEVKNSDDDSVALQTREDSSETSENTATKSGLGEAELTPEEQQQVQELKARDQEVRVHEAAHVAAGGPYVTGGPTYTYQTGPDGKSYAIGGEVGIDTSEVGGDPKATIQKMQTVAAAALAPAEPSGQDQKVAAAARQKEAQARAELAQQNSSALTGNNENENSESSQSAAAEDKPQSASSATETTNQTDSDKSDKSDKIVANSGLRSAANSFAAGFAKSTQQSSAYQAQSSMPLSSASSNRFSVFA